MKKKRLLILGSTGSVGRNVLDVVGRHSGHFEVVGLSARANSALLAEQCAAHPGARFLVHDPETHLRLRRDHAELAGRAVEPGDNAFARILELSEPDLLVNCLVGFVGLKPTLAALAAGVPVALANKEAVVTGGEILIEASRKSGASIIPIDSEHVALSQCLAGSRIEDVKQVFLTASGGALRDRSLDNLNGVKIGDVLAHPTWRMGDKITVDSATLLNKGFEVIEAHWLFGLPFEKINVVIHPQSIIHCLVEFKDNSILSQMGTPDMRLPILYALTYPDRVETSVARSRITDFPGLTLRELDEERYPCFSLAIRAARAGGNSPAILNSANEAAVGAFLAGKIGFSRIYDVLERAMDVVKSGPIGSFEDILAADRKTREFIRKEFGI
jgi:1-deoxy-D-xylulose-5-phosphate reductoisomerase